MRLEPAAPRSRVKHYTTEPLRSLKKTRQDMIKITGLRLIFIFAGHTDHCLGLVMHNLKFWAIISHVCTDWNISFKHLQHNWAVTCDFHQCGMCNQQSLRAIRALLVAWIFYDCWATDWTSFGVSKLKRRLHRLVWVYTCQNATLLEITCRGSNFNRVCWWLFSVIVLLLTQTIQFG